jgi:dipeptidyl aminopeptidase/acylaminoacyl peptidase
MMQARSTWRSLAGLAIFAWSASFVPAAIAQQSGAAAATQEQPSRPEQIPVSAFGKRPFLQRPRLSPDGAKIAATVDVNGKPQLAVIYVQGGSKGMPLIDVGGHQIRWYAWAGNDRVLVSLLMDGKFYGYDVSVSRLALYEVSTGRAAQIGLKVQGFVGDDVIHIADDGSHILLSAAVNVVTNPGVYRVDLATLEMEVVERQRNSVAVWIADREGVVRAGYGFVENRLRVIYRDRAGEDFRTLANLRLDDSDDEIDTFRIPTRSDKGFVVTNGRTGRFALYEFDWKTSEIGKPLFEHPQVDIDDFWMNEAGDAVEAIFYTDDRERVVWFDPEMKQLQEEIDRAMPGRINWVTSASRDRTRFIVWTGAADDPGIYYYYDRPAARLQRIATPFESLKGRKLAPVQFVTYRARDGLEIPAYLTMPAGREPKGLPLVLLPHGGPHVRDTWTFDYWAQFLANRGYVVLQPNFRGSAGYGTEFLAKGFGQWGTGMQDHLTDGVQWLVSQGTVDPERICIMGGSYGGYAALMGAIRTPEVFRCAISWAGVTDLNAMMRHDRTQLLPSRYRKWRERVRGAAEVDLKTVSPVRRAAEVGVPILLMHGTDDENVPYRQAEDFVKAMKKAGKAIEFIEFPTVGHSPEKTEDRIRLLGAIEAFLAKHNPAD